MFQMRRPAEVPTKSEATPGIARSCHHYPVGVTKGSLGPAGGDAKFCARTLISFPFI